jgi:hypothetical protein
VSANQIPITMPLAQRLLLAAELALVPHTPGDDHTGPAARKVVLAVLDQLTRTASADVARQIRDVREVVNEIAADLVSGEDRSEPPPAPREWREGDAEPPVGYDLLEDAEGDRIARTVNGWVWTRVEGKDYGVTPWSPGKAWSELPWSDVGGGVLSEVVTPEGTS